MTTGLIALLVTAVPVVAVLACITGAVLPLLLLRRRAVTRQAQVRASWPDAIDALVSGIRAGLSLGQALADLGRIGPDPLKGVFREFETDLRASSFRTALTNLQERCADPVADRVAAALVIAHESGGSDLVNLMRSLATMLREDARTRGEIRARQSWTINGARLAVIAPWATLALLCTRPEAVDAYSTPEGAVVVLLAAVASAVAYALMLRMARLPREPRWTA